MKVTVFGTGYVGLVTGACLAEVGNDVLCVDIDAARIAGLQQGIIPIFEPGLQNLVQENQKAGRLQFGTDIKQAVQHGLFQFIAVGTPSDEDGSADLHYVLNVAQSIAKGVAIFAKDCFGHPSPSNRQKLNATNHCLRRPSRPASRD